MVPLADGSQGLGALIVGWRAPHRHLTSGDRQAVEILTTEAAATLLRQRAQAVTTRQATTDALTGIANRHRIDQRMQELREGDAVVIVDLDHFKRVNDEHGHAVGDATIRTMARCLRETCRSDDDWCGRLGGEEFVLVLSGSGEAGAASVLERLRASWQREQALTTFSAGVALHQRPHDCRETLARADAALYRAKHLGRDRVEHADGRDVMIAV
jgi:diguanylate cyclase (GGDEF)-like protein